VAGGVAAAGEGEGTAKDGVGGLQITGVEVQSIAGSPVEFRSGAVGYGGSTTDLDKLAGFGFGKLIQPQDQPPVLGAQREIRLDGGNELASILCHSKYKKTSGGVAPCPPPEVRHG
jgi:hypothetical protein